MHFSHKKKQTNFMKKVYHQLSSSLLIHRIPPTEENKILLQKIHARVHALLEELSRKSEN
jgi:hypothetical protein